MSHKKLDIIAAPDKPTIVTRRVVDAPRELVFDAFTKSELLKRWMGPRNLTMEIKENDLRVGGRYHFVHRNSEGREFAFHGEYKEIVRPSKIVRTFVFGTMEAYASLETLTLEESDGKTTITTLTEHTTMEGRDGHLGGGNMEKGMSDGYARLDDLLVEVAEI